jgi:ASC-1-like (ASCH) protein
LYRKQDYAKVATDVFPGDWYLHLFHAQFGKIGFIDEVMSVYRRHEGGLWWDAHNEISKIWIKYGVEHLNLYREQLFMYGKQPERRKIIKKNIFKMIQNIAEADIKYGENVMKKVSDNYASYISEYLMLSNNNIDKLTHQAAAAQNEVKHFKELYQKELEKNHTITNSRLWKTRNKVAPLLGKHKI